jgi:hypothetical protein
VTPASIRKLVAASARRVRSKARGSIIRPTAAQIDTMRRALAAVDAEHQKNKTR